MEAILPGAFVVGVIVVIWKGLGGEAGDGDSNFGLASFVDDLD